MNTAIQIYTAGYGRWPAADRWNQLVRALQKAEVDLLVDIRHSACASQLEPDNTYGPRDWHVRQDHQGITSRLRDVGIGYLWAVELGNPQKTDPAMTILREHLAEPHGEWPIHRGLDLVSGIIRSRGSRCCLLCACSSFARCHRKLVVEALIARLGAGTTHKDLTDTKNNEARRDRQRRAF